MANGFGSLERFFTKKKTPAASTEAAEPTPAPPTIPRFPSPSFIRPKTSRMAAREEVRKQPASRALSPTPLSPHRMDFMTNAQSPTRSSNSHQSQYSPLKTSFMPMRAESFLDEFDVYQFPRPPTHHGETSAAASTYDPKSSMEAPSERSLPHRPHGKPVAGDLRLETPPSSDLEDEAIRSPRYFRDKRLPALPQREPPTPDSSPERHPVHISQLRVSKSIDFLNKSVYRDIRRQLAETLDHRPLRRTISQSSLTPSTSRLSIASSTLREPDFKEFFNLSDDDIAESAPAEAIEETETTTSSTAPSTFDSPRSSLLTLTPPYASKPATAAAFEAARIAKRYNFDFVYVVNLWTDHTQPRPNTFANPRSPGKNKKPLSGRLLAAYGLENVNLPFQISTAAHGKILTTPGWIEYRAKEVRNDEFARGYACAFYTGECSQSGPGVSRNSTSSAQSMNTDRGIIFAAYRKPRGDGSLIGVSSSPADLVHVHKDAEALVEMLVDIHVANRLRDPQSQFHQSEETGPMPAQRFTSLGC
ncbi:hypothetical protein F66182_4368 [Fusarium sp. NRRL 66182]|nr:hypothetical protein F66182_4368 [Fusarium sp. NRRL 66182]